jgi:hypothetical protein
MTILDRLGAPGVMRWLRRMALVAWAGGLTYQIVTIGVPVDREGVLLWIAGGVAAATLGKRALLTVVVDFLPLALVLLVYDYLRGIADTLGMPTWWHPQLQIDKAMFFGHVPTLWLQEHLKYATPQWWDVPVAFVYLSFFVAPWALAAVLWLRSRDEFKRWASRYVALSFLAFAFFALTPAAPPWAAARCTASEVVHHPASPPCIDDRTAARSGGLIGLAEHPQPGAKPYVQRTSTRGLTLLHLDVARDLVHKGQRAVDRVAAVPSLHAGAIMLLVLFLWRRVRKRWRPLLVLYPPAMGFALVYAADHYVFDVLVGWGLAAAVMIAFARFERPEIATPKEPSDDVEPVAAATAGVE